MATPCSEPGCEKKAVSRGKCQRHYQRAIYRGEELPPPKNKRVGEGDGECATTGCTGGVVARGLCSRCYYKARASGNVPAPRRKGWSKEPTRCPVDGCNRFIYANGLCAPHNQRRKNGHSLEGPFQRRDGAGWLDPSGYRLIYKPGHPNSYRGKVQEHRYIMSEYIGRPLLEHESVHHKNGDRADNRLDNLELWSSSQPSGQRIEDKIAWAIEILRTYKPGALCGTT